MVDAAFSLAYFEVSDVIEISTGYNDGYTILYKINKTKDYFEECYETIKTVYIENEIGKILDTAADTLESSAQSTSFLLALDRSTISMK